jgi:hypothetical protein
VIVYVHNDIDANAMDERLLVQHALPGTKREGKKKWIIAIYRLDEQAKYKAIE